jgi:1-acyl-sn-glycerol-3-phosphate acyltransferase
MKKIVLKSYLYLSIAVFLLAMLAMYPVIVLSLYLFGEKGRRIAHHGYRLWGGSLQLIGIHIKMVNRERLPTAGPVVYIVNHQSLLDTVAVFWTVKRPFKALAKAELGKPPLVGQLMRLACIMVKRDEAGSRSASLGAMMRHFAKGHSLLLYPEGRMNKNPPALQPFSDAGIQIAMRQKVTLQPMTVVGAGKLLPAYGEFQLYPGTLTVYVGTPILPEEYANLTPQQVSQNIQTWMDSHLS